MTQTITVELANRSYPIHIGRDLLAQAGAMIAALRPSARCAIVTDDTVNALHGDTLRRSLNEAGIANITIEIRPGEVSKRFEVLQDVVSGLLDARLERADLVIAFGGGVVGDLAGFAAAITRRGMDFVQIPTTLLAQVDSSVGGKTGINADQGKNLVGAFHQPVLVLADTGLLSTLPLRELRAGYAEVVKYGLIDQPEFFEWLEANHEEVLALGPALETAVARSCASKAAIVAADETETGQRALLNLGHTFGHALEAHCRYDSTRLVHGEGVAIGMMLAHEFSNRLNLCDADAVARVRSHLQASGLPVSVRQIPGDPPTAEQLLGHIGQDKKVRRGALTFILTRGLGKSYIASDVAPGQVLSFLGEKLES